MTLRNIREHDCRCRDWPDCVLHGAAEFGGGEPDICQPHEHLSAALTAEEAMARRVIAAAMDGLTPEQTERVVANVLRSELRVVNPDSSISGGTE